MSVRGRKREINVEREILNLLKDLDHETGFRFMHSQIGHCSKTTLSNSLKLLVSQNKIIKTKKRKYKINNSQDFLVNIKKLEHILNKLEKYFPTFSDKQLALLGIKLWTLVFQTEFHPISFHLGSKTIPISYDTPKSKKTEIISHFFESRDYMSYFENKMYELFFNFCSGFSSSLLENVFDKVLYLPLTTPTTNQKSFLSQALPFHEVLNVVQDHHSIYYGTAFCNLLYSIDVKSVNKTNLEKIKNDISKFEMKFLEI